MTTELMAPTDEVATLEKQYRKAMNELKPRHRKFIRSYIVTDNISKSAVVAGFAPRSAPGIGSNLLKKPKVQAAYQLGLQLEALVHGVPMAVKRSWLIDLVNKCRTPDSSTWNPQAANKSIELLARFDGQLDESGSKAQTQIVLNINTGIDSAAPGVTIEGETVTQ